MVDGWVDYFSRISTFSVYTNCEQLQIHRSFTSTHNETYIIKVVISPGMQKNSVMSITYVLLFLHSTLHAYKKKDIYHLQSAFTELLSIQSTSLILLIF